MASNYPSSIDDASTLLNPVDKSSTRTLSTTLSALALSGDTTLAVVDTTATGFASTYGVLTIDDEIIIYTGKTATSFTGCVRGAFGSTAAGHSNGATVRALMVAGYIQRLQEAVVAIQNAIGTTGAFNFVEASGGTFDASDVVNTPTGNIAATDVQAALNELDGEKVAGPGSATSANLASFNGTTGKLIQDASIAAANVVTAASTLTSNLPMIGGGSKAAAVGTRSGNTTEFATITGTKTTDKQLAFDASGNIIASSTAIGGTGSGDSTRTGAIGSVPAASNDGDIYLPDNSYYLLRDTGAAYAYWATMRAVTPPAALSGWTVLNQGGSTIEDYRGGIRVVIPTSTAAGIRGFHKTAPSAPYSVTVGLLWMPAATDGAHVCAGWRQSSDGKLAVIRLRRANPPEAVSTKYTDESTFSANYTTHGVGWMPQGPLLWLQFEDDNSNRIVRYSTDGLNWVQLHTVGRTDFLTGDQLVFGLDNNGSTASSAYAVLLHWAQA